MKKLIALLFCKSIMVKSMQQPNKLMQISQSSRSWISLLPDLTTWFFPQTLLFHSDQITSQLFSTTAQSHIEAKPAKLEIDFQTSKFQCSWIPEILEHQLSCRHLQKSDTVSQPFPFFQEPMQSKQTILEKMWWSEAPGSKIARVLFILQTCYLENYLA